MKRKPAFIILMCVWFLLIASYVAYKEYSLNFGKTVFLKVMPIDPRDLFRGDYVILDYEISQINEHQKILGSYGGYIEQESLKNGETVYVKLEKDGSVYKAGDIYKDTPKKGIFIKGKVTKKQRFFGLNNSNFTIIYGIENFFVPEGEGLYIEEQREINNLYAEIKINSYGNATIKNLYIENKKVEFNKK